MGKVFGYFIGWTRT